MMLKVFMCLNYLALKIYDYIINFTFEAHTVQNLAL